MKISPTSTAKGRKKMTVESSAERTHTPQVVKSKGARRLRTPVQVQLDGRTQDRGSTSGWLAALGNCLRNTDTIQATAASETPTISHLTTRARSAAFISGHSKLKRSSPWPRST